MTLDEAIKHAEKVAKAKEREAKINRNHGGWAYDDEATKCSACAEEHRQLAEWLKELKQLREQTRWIPVSERLPNDEDYVLVCYEDGHIRTAYYYIYNEDFMYEQDVMAWMPLPKPYEPQESEDK